MKIYYIESSCSICSYDNKVEGMKTFEVPDSLWEEYQILQKRISEIVSEFDKLDTVNNV